VPPEEVAYLTKELRLFAVVPPPAAFVPPPAAAVASETEAESVTAEPIRRPKGRAVAEKVTA
jgi:hypothetical protein